MNIQSNIDHRGRPARQNCKRTDKLVADERSQIERIFLRYKNDVQRYLVSLVRSDDDAHDLLQDTYLKLCTRQNIEDLNNNPKAYLFVVATNLAKDFMRRRSTRQESKHVCINSVEIEANSASPEAMAEWNGNLDSIKKTLLTLDSKTKQVFVMRRFMGYSAADIATHMKISKRTVERHLVNALDKIKSDLDKRNHND
ncbi:RNA polymerase sigma factor [Kordiimonas sp.]|uniref:RNA polymerase sigma factor n=1 Tax=Kordiimonas sp. TaxID=1970157 RepID=UPI003A8F5419